MHYVKTGERLYGDLLDESTLCYAKTKKKHSDYSCNWTYSQDVDKYGDPLIVGGFTSDGFMPSGLEIRSSYSLDYYGAAGCWKL